MISTFNQVLSCIINDPNRAIGTLNFFSERNRQQVWSWNEKLPNVEDQLIHEMIAAQVKSRPNAEAVCSFDGNFSYCELDRMSTQLAQHLIGLGIGPETMVPFCFEKSSWTIVAMLAVLKAGGAFVPLDPSYPASRLQHIISTVEAKVLLSSRQHCTLCAGFVETTVIVDRQSIYEMAISPQASSPVTQSNSAAYVIFTSGTTGMPKGTIVEHSAFCTSSIAHGKALAIQPTSRALQFASYTFDACLVEILTTLIHGGCVCVPSEEDRLNNTAEAINRANVNWTLLTPSVASRIAPESVPTLQTLVLGGEAVSSADIKTWGPKLHLVNAYGPTECAVVATANSQVTEANASNIGWAVGGHCWIVDQHDHDRLVPIGCVGELIVEGPTLARGYLNNDLKTIESFIVNPTWAADNKDGGSERRMYKTGDLVRYNSNGSINYVSRKDTQIKLHGQRIELGEIESHLVSDSQVQHALVLMPTLGYCAKRLVAVLSLREFAGPVPTAATGGLEVISGANKDVAALEVANIRERLSDHLPRYMVPAIWTVVDGIPLLPSGKLDRKQVARWIEDMSKETYNQITDVGVEDESAVPATAIERQLQHIWSRVLNISVEQIGLNRSFLSLGGDSISAMQVMSECRTEGIGLTVQDILRSKTISQIALCAKSVEQAKYQDEELDHVFDLSPIQKLYFESTNHQSGQFNQSFLLRIKQKMRAQDVSGAIEALVLQHSMLRARFSRKANNTWQQRITRDTSSSLCFRTHNITASDEINSIIMQSQKSIDIEQGPVFAVDLFNPEDGGQLLFLVASHLTIDLVSWRVILQDLEALLVSGTLVAEKPLSFQTWCRMQAEHAESNSAPALEATPSDLGYWGMTDQPNNYADAIGESFMMDAKTTALVLGTCHEALRTEPVDIFLSAIIYSFSQVFSDRSPPTIYNESHGRESWDSKIDISRTVGWFTTMCPLFVPLLATDSIAKTVRQVKDARRRIPDNGRSYFASRFLTAEGKEQYMGHLPMEATFNYLGQYQQLERDDALLQQEGEISRDAMDVGQNVSRMALFEISVAVVQGCIQVTFLYNRRMKQQMAIQQWISGCKQALYEAAEQLRVMKATPTLSDFPLLPFTYDVLDKLTAQTLPKIGVSSVEEVEDIYPCSPMQQSLLLSQSKTPTFYALNFIWQVSTKSGESHVNVQRLANAWRKVVDRHGALRTLFIESLCQTGLFDQIVLKHVQPRITLVLCDDDTEALNTLNKQQPIDYTSMQPPHRMTICESSEGGVFIKLEISHAIIDGTSMQLLLRDLGRAYMGKLPKLAAPSYSGYLQHIQNGSTNAAITYWQSFLGGIEPCHFPKLNDRLTGPKQLQSIEVRFEQAPQLNRFCEENSLTVSNVLQTAWGLVLRCFTGLDEVSFGYLTSGRDAPVNGIQDAVGTFINMLVCRMNLGETTTIDQVLQKTQADYIRSLSYQHCSLAEIQHGLRISGSALFNTAMNLQKVLRSTSSEEAPLSFQNLSAHDPSEVRADLS